MMALTHALVSLALLAAASPVLSDPIGLPVLVAAFVGGLAPDLDVVAAHRRSLHYPVGYTLATVALAVAALAAPGSDVFVVAIGVAAAALHAWSDVLAGSVEPAPWNPTTERAVYNHALGGWHRPRRLVRYSGAPEDFLLSAVAAGTAVLAPATGPTLDAVVLWLVALAGTYSLMRRRLPAVRARLAGWLPQPFVRALPAVALVETDGGSTRLALRRP